LKNQYLGDINDYRKYGLIRCLMSDQLRVTVCWMLTPDDGRSDGGKLSYLDQPDRWRRFDPSLYDGLREIVSRTTRRGAPRDLDELQTSGILDGCRFHDMELGDGREDRVDFFIALEPRLSDTDLLFFDPDNGLEVPSTGKGRRGSSKYLYWDEAARFFAGGTSLLIYQHIPRVKRRPYAEGLLARCRAETGARHVYALQTSSVLFLLAAQPPHVAAIERGLRAVDEVWADQIELLDRFAPGKAAHTF